MDISSTLYSIYFLIGKFLCHQIPERTLYFENNPLPLCARCTGIYLGFLLGLVVFFTFRKKSNGGLPDIKFQAILTIPIMVDWLTQTMGLRLSTNPIRVITGLMFGLELGTIIPYIIAYLNNGVLPILKISLPEFRIDDRNEPIITAKGYFISLITVIPVAFLLLYVTNLPASHFILSTIIIVSAMLLLTTLLISVFLEYRYLSRYSRISMSSHSSIFNLALS